MTASSDILSRFTTKPSGYGVGVAIPPVGECLRSARERAGWSRETLAYHSGLSVAAIAQIESGRRRDVRLGSLLALAGALGVGVDYLATGKPGPPPKLLGHTALIYGSDDEFVASTLPFLAEGLRRDDCVLAVTAGRQTSLLRDALGSDTVRVEFRDASQWYRSPLSTLDHYRRYLQEGLQRGNRWFWIVGEPVWAGLTDDEVLPWIRYESMVNLSLASFPATVMCPYDARSVPERALAYARHTHPELAAGPNATASPEYIGPEEFLLTLR